MFLSLSLLSMIYIYAIPKEYITDLSRYLHLWGWIWIMHVNGYKSFNYIIYFFFQVNVNCRLPQVCKDDTCTIMYTSGTTGDPKGVILTNRAVITQVINTEQLILETDKAVSCHCLTSEIWSFLFSFMTLFLLIYDTYMLERLQLHHFVNVIIFTPSQVVTFESDNY